MEELPIRECKNCYSNVQGDYCSFCGQRYHDHKETFGELVYEFMSDLVHFDSRFFKTIIPLLFSPGKLTKSYNEGKRQGQFHPIRLYIFSSFVYFFLFFYFNNVENGSVNLGINTNQAALIIDGANNPVKTDTLGMNQNSESANSYIDSLLLKKVTPIQYLEQQQTLSKKRKDGFFKRIVIVRLLKINQIDKEGELEYKKKLAETFLHNIPKMLFFLLPLFAFFLKLLYIRKKQFYYVDHAILSLHYFSLVFIVLILSQFVLGKIFNPGIFTFIAFVWLSVYLLIAMKKLYGQRWWKTIFKFTSLGFLCFFAMFIMLTANLAWSVFVM